ncbi:MAG: translation elongation factor 4 [bacterium]
MQHIRNFSIIAHIDHGKSTLADRIIETTGMVEKRKMKDRILDTLDLEQERGITIKLQTARMHYEYEKEGEFKGSYILNLIDTPGHVDFSYEVSRSIAACEGVVLLVDATQGVQAQTLSVFYQAMDLGLTIIPVINKIDLPSAQIEETKKEIVTTLGFKEEEIIMTSGKTGQGVKELLDAIVERIPSPDKNYHFKEEVELSESSSLKALIFDSFFHEHKGVIALVRIFKGEIDSNKSYHLMGTDTDMIPVELGYLTPDLEVSGKIENGEVGYIATGFKDIKHVRVGDTLVTTDDFNADRSIIQLSGYKPAKPMVFASVFPVEADEFPSLTDAIEKLSLNDASLSYTRQFSPALGSGYLCGYLGLLHMEITQERLEREFNVNLITTSPTVEYKVELTTTNTAKIENVNKEDFDDKGLLVVKSVSKFPDLSYIVNVFEPFSALEIITPEEFMGPIMQLCSEKRGVFLNMEYVTPKNTSFEGSKKHVIIKYEIPTNEIITDFFDRMKSISQGYASMDYQFKDFRQSDIVKVSILVNHEITDPLSFLCHKSVAEARGRKLVERLKDLIPRQQFPIPIQASIGSKIVAREDISAYKKNVLEGMSGGHVERKMKLLQAQKKGKKRLKMLGSVEVPKEAFLAALKN